MSEKVTLVEGLAIKAKEHYDESMKNPPEEPDEFYHGQPKFSFNLDQMKTAVEAPFYTNTPRITSFEEFDKWCDTL